MKPLVHSANLDISGPKKNPHIAGQSSSFDGDYVTVVVR